MSTIIQKLTSRKLWLGVALVLIGVILCLTGDTENGIAIIKIGGVGYLGAETICDIIRGIWSSDTDDTTDETVVVTDDLTTDTLDDYIEIVLDDEEVDET